MRKLTAVICCVLAAASVGSCAQDNGHPADRTSETSARPALATPVPSPSSQPWGNCGNIRNEADARSLVAAGRATALVTARIAGTAVRSDTVLAGRAPGFQRLDASVPAGKYLVLLGGDSTGGYYAAFGLYGVYHLTGGHAFQLCAYGDPHVGTRVARHGVTEARHVIELLEHALGTTPA